MAGKQLIEFNAEAFVKALGKELKKAVQNIRNDIFATMKDNIREMNFKDNEVRLAFGKTTSDKQRRGALLASLADDQARWITSTSLSTVITAMKTNFKESHIGIYYEYGTGEKQDQSGPKYESWGQVNPFRIPNTGQPIVTRSRMQGMGGMWTDIGGNMRVTNSPQGGDPYRLNKSGDMVAGVSRKERFKRYVGDDIKAYHWFSNALGQMKARAMKRIMDAIKKIDVRKYFTVAGGTGIFTLGED